MLKRSVDRPVSFVFNSREAIAAIIGDIVIFFTTRRGVLRFYRFFLAESKFVHDLNFDFFLFEHLPPFLIVEFCFRTLNFNSSFVSNE